jgi:hypothetical protein
MKPIIVWIADVPGWAVWIADVPGWAYDNRAKRLSAALPDFEHRIVFNPVRNLGECLKHFFEAKLIVCPDPRLLCLFPLHEKIILHLNAIKIFT